MINKQMENKKQLKKIIIMICIVIVVLYLVYGMIFKFIGKEDIQEYSYTINAKRLDTTKSVQMDLKENDILDIEVLKHKGILYFDILSEDGENVYQGTGITSSVFSVRIPKNSKYTITLKGKRAKAYLKIQKHKTIGDE